MAAPPPPPIVLQFRNDNQVVQFLATLPGTVFARLINFPLGVGGDVYAADAGNRSAIYNAHDDKMYFLAEKTDVDAPGHYLIQYDPRTLAISGTMELPAGWTVGNSELIDCTKERAWINSIFDGTMRAFSTLTFLEVFTDSGDFSAPPFATSSGGISCDNGIILIADSADAATVHRITVTGAATYTDDPVTLTGDVVFDTTGSYRRCWVQPLNKALLKYTDGSTGFIGALLDVNTLTPHDIPMLAGWTAAGIGNSDQWWDPSSTSNYMTGSIFYVDVDENGFYGIDVIDPATATVHGVAALNSTDWDTGSPAMPLLNGNVWAVNLVFVNSGGGAFNEATPSVTPSFNYEASASTSIPDGLNFDPIHFCIAPSQSVDELTVTTEASVGGPLGISVTDTATLSGGFDESGAQLTFTLYTFVDGVCEDLVFTFGMEITGDGVYESDGFIPLAPGTYCWIATTTGNSGGDVTTECGDPDELVTIGEAVTIDTVATPGGAVGVTLTDSATLANFDSPTGTITFFLFGPDDDTCGLEPIFTSDPITVAGNGTYVSAPGYIPVVEGTYRWTAAYSGDENNDPFETECNAINETSIVTQVSPPQGGGASPGNCGVQFERLELFHMLKSLMGGGRTLKEALKFLDQDDIDFLEEEGYMEELPQEIPKPMRQGNSPKMVNRRIDLAPINQLNKLIDEFEVKLQDCVHRSVGEYEK